LGLYLEKHGHRFSWRGFFEAMVNDEVLVNSLATYLELTSLEKQLLLEADTLTQRARRFCDLFQLKMYERDGRRGWG
jgi:Lon protease-like protein